MIITNPSHLITLKWGGVLSFDDKQLEFKKDGRIFYNGEQIYYECQNKVNCHTCHGSCNNCAGSCNNCDACNKQCNSCTACNTCWNCVKCNERCNACTICVGCTALCHGCTGCQTRCNYCNANCYVCDGCYIFSCNQGTGCAVGSVECDSQHTPGCFGKCNGGCYGSSVCYCRTCVSKCYFFDGAPGDCNAMYTYYYITLKKPR